MKNEKDTIIHISLNKELHKGLKTEAAIKETSMTDLIGVAVTNYLKSHSLVQNQ
jgi:hypothetical protein